MKYFNIQTILNELWNETNVSKVESGVEICTHNEDVTLSEVATTLNKHDDFIYFPEEDVAYFSDERDCVVMQIEVREYNNMPVNESLNCVFFGYKIGNTSG